MSATEQSEKAGSNKAEAITQVAQELIQTRGYDGFSYRDVADRVGIKSASVHYHFPAKADLALAVAQQYRANFAETVAALDHGAADPVQRLEGFAAIFQNTLEDLHRVCLCGMLASEANSLPGEVRQEIQGFFTDQAQWLAATITDGIQADQINSQIDPDAFAQLFLSALEGAMMMALSMERPEHLAGVANQLMSLLS